MEEHTIYNNTATKREKFINDFGKKIKIEGAKGNQAFLQLARSLITQSGLTLEIGTGTGVMPCWLGPLNKKMICVDFSANMLKIAKKNCKNFPNIKFIKADLNFLPFKKNTFDLVIKRLASDNLKEVRRVLKQNGSFLNFTNGQKDGKELKEMFGLSLHESTQEYRKKLLNYGFTLKLSKKFLFKEIYHDLKILIKILEITPLLPDFSEKKQMYTSKLKQHFLKNDLFILTRHKYLTYAVKTI